MVSKLLNILSWRYPNAFVSSFSLLLLNSKIIEMGILSLDRHLVSPRLRVKVSGDLIVARGNSLGLVPLLTRIIREEIVDYTFDWSHNKR